MKAFPVVHNLTLSSRMKLVAVIIAFATVVTTSVTSQTDLVEETDLITKLAKEYETAYDNLTKELREDAELLTPELINKYGYPSEIHTVISNDGYVLEMHRIPHGKNGPSKNRPAVYLQHGLLCSSADWVTPGPSRGFAYILADAGYDVWLPNVRGTRYSRNHTSLHPSRDAKKFWNFSWHEIAMDDVPTMVDYVRENTKQDKIFYIGHSQGSTISYIMLSERKEYNYRFRAVFSLAPVAYMGRLTSPLLRILAFFEGPLEVLGNLIGMYEFLPHSKFLGQVGHTLCGDESIFQILCTNSLFALCGFNRKQMNATMIPVIMGHTPAGSSTKQLLHFAQEIRSKRFRRWDYGLFGNLKRYGSLKPPSYKLKNVKAPVYLHYSRNDWLSNVRDVNKLAKELGNLQGKFLSPDNKFNHVDYLFGVDAPELLYYRVLGLMKRH